MYLKSRAITTDTVFFAPPAVASISFLPAPRAHNAPIYFHFYRLKSTNISFWGWEILQIVLFIRGMWSHVVLLFVAARSSRGTAAVASSGRSTRRKRRRRRCTSTSGIKSSTSTCISTSTKNGGGSSSSTTKCSNGSTGAAAWHMQEQQRLALLDAQTHTQSQSYAPQPAPSTHHQGEFEVKRKAHGAWGLGGPPRPASPTTSNQPVLQPAQPGPGSAPPAEYL